MEPLQIIVWICVLTFAATVIITLLALLNLIQLPDEKFLSRLFQVLIVEIIVAGVGAFSIFIVDEISSDIENQIKITNHILEPLKGDTSKVEYKITVYGSYFSKESEIEFSGNAIIDGYNMIIPDSTKVNTDNNGVWNLSFFHTVNYGNKDDISIELFIIDPTGKKLSKDSYLFTAGYRSPCIDPILN